MMVLPARITSMNAKDWHFPMACKACGAQAATPFRVSTERARLSVEIKCGECQQEWTIVAPAPLPFLKIKADRRRESEPALLKRPDK